MATRDERTLERVHTGELTCTIVITVERAARELGNQITLYVLLRLERAATAGAAPRHFLLVLATCRGGAGVCARRPVSGIEGGKERGPR